MISFCPCVKQVTRIITLGVYHASFAQSPPPIHFFPVKQGPCMTSTTLAPFPAEIWCTIFEYLHLPDLNAISMSCKALRALTHRFVSQRNALFAKDTSRLGIWPRFKRVIFSKAVGYDASIKLIMRYWERHPDEPSPPRFVLESGQYIRMADALRFSIRSIFLVEGDELPESIRHEVISLHILGGQHIPCGNLRELSVEGGSLALDWIPKTLEILCLTQCRPVGVGCMLPRLRLLATDCSRMQEVEFQDMDHWGQPIHPVDQMVVRSLHLHLDLWSPLNSFPALGSLVISENLGTMGPLLDAICGFIRRNSLKQLQAPSRLIHHLLAEQDSNPDLKSLNLQGLRWCATSIPSELRSALQQAAARTFPCLKDLQVERGIFPYGGLLNESPFKTLRSLFLKECLISAGSIRRLLGDNLFMEECDIIGPAGNSGQDLISIPEGTLTLRSRFLRRMVLVNTDIPMIVINGCANLKTFNVRPAVLLDLRFAGFRLEVFKNRHPMTRVVRKARSFHPTEGWDRLPELLAPEGVIKLCSTMMGKAHLPAFAAYFDATPDSPKYELRQLLQALGIVTPEGRFRNWGMLMSTRALYIMPLKLVFDKPAPAVMPEDA